MEACVMSKGGHTHTVSTLPPSQRGQEVDVTGAETT